MRRTALLVAIASAGLVAMVFAAGASSNQTKSQSGTVTLEAAQGVSVLDPYKKLFQYSTALYPLLWNTLTAYTVNKGAVPQPQLAKSWKSSGGGKVYTLHDYSPGLKFSDGSPIMQRRCAFAPPCLRYQRTAFFYASFFPKVTSVTAKGTSQVVIKLATASNVLPTLLTLAPIEQVAALSQINTKPVVSGPFMVQEFTPNVSLTLVPNPKYWGTKPKVSAIKVVNAQDSTAAVSALQSGSADVLWGIPWNKCDRSRTARALKRHPARAAIAADICSIPTIRARRSIT